MNGKTIFTPTEARQNFFNILKWVRAGREIKIKSEDTIVRLTIEDKDDKKTKEKIRAWNRLRKMNIPSMPVKEMKKIILTMHDIKLEK